jgi:carboxymethylenebutenolidase
MEAEWRFEERPWRLMLQMFRQVGIHALLLACTLLCACVSRSASDIQPPAGTEDLVAEWISIPHNEHTIPAAIVRPEGRGPFPAVIVVHGSHGLAREYMRLARDLSQAGRVAIVPCWFSGGAGEGVGFVTPIACPGAPPRPGGDSPEAREILHSIVQSIRNLDGVVAHRVALFGHSRGGGASLHYILAFDDVEAVAVNSAGYPPSLTGRASEVAVPILILHGEADSPGEGGSPMTDVRMARAFEAALRAAGKPVEAVYYDGAGHNAIFTNPDLYADELARLRQFLRRTDG